MTNRVSTTERRLKVAVIGVLSVAAAMLATGCSNGTEEPSPEAGGTLQLGAVADCRAACDPQKQQDQFPEFIYDCCLLRTLVRVSPADGGPKVVPDIAEAEPSVSPDDLTYTFTIRDGVMFGPPVSRPVTAEDFVTTFERALAPSTQAFDADKYMSIVGARDYSNGDTSKLAGVKAIDDQTLRITLSKPDPLFLVSISNPSAAPIPKEAANGHAKDYGRFIVSTGPYMLQGSQNVDLSKPADQPEPASGYRPGQSMVLVRNSDWERSSDPISGEYAYADQIEISIGGTPEDYGQKILQGELDLQVDGKEPGGILRQFSSDPSLEDQIVTGEAPATSYASLTVAEPPFDDVHVRRAVNWMVDKAAVLRLLGGPLNGTVAYHVFPEVSLGGALADYKPFGTPDDAGSLEEAKAEMRLSKYDTDRDGLCDAPECTEVVALGDPSSPGSEIAQSIEQDLSQIGIDLKLRLLANRFDVLAEPSNRVPMNIWAAWGSTPYDAADIAGPVFGSGFIGPKACCNEVLLGATAAQLEEWGYPATKVPSVDRDIARCEGIPLGSDRTQCWADLDMKLTHELAAWIPLYWEVLTRVVSDRVVSAPWDPKRGFIAIEQMALTQ